jgi:hypothetical protein
MTQLTDYQDSDPYKPLAIKDYVHQYDNFQIYSLYCIDRIYSISGTKVYYTGDSVSGYDGTPTDGTVFAKDFVAVQAYSPHRKIPCDFRSIANQYHD